MLEIVGNTVEKRKNCLQLHILVCLVFSKGFPQVRYICV